MQPTSHSGIGGATWKLQINQQQIIMQGTSLLAPRQSVPALHQFYRFLTPPLIASCGIVAGLFMTELIKYLSRSMVPEISSA